MMRMISIIFGVAAVAVLSALISQSPGNSVPNEEPSAANESTSSMQINPKCGNSAEGVQAGSIIANTQTLTYHGYVVQKVNRKVRVDTPPGYGPSSSVDVSYATISLRGKLIATLNAGVYFGLGNATEMGFFSLLDNGRKQLIISQDVPKGGRQWVVDFDQRMRIIFDGQEFAVGREAYDMAIADLDGDQIFEVIEWANTSPADARVSEALFIAAKANESYKYGCNGWESDKETKQQAEAILRTRYPQSPWTAKLSSKD